jgi:hypothetical protein
VPVKEEGDAVAGACSTGRNGPSLTNVQTAAAAAFWCGRGPGAAAAERVRHGDVEACCLGAGRFCFVADSVRGRCDILLFKCACCNLFRRNGVCVGSFEADCSI